METNIKLTDRKTLLDILPEPESKREVSLAYRDAYQYLQESGKEDATSEEVMFISLLTRFIDLFTRARGMVANNRFTVDYCPPYPTTRLDLQHFFIVPIKQKDEENKTNP